VAVRSVRCLVSELFGLWYMLAEVPDERIVSFEGRQGAGFLQPQWAARRKETPIIE
jgi:hypothetical protein